MTLFRRATLALTLFGFLAGGPITAHAQPQPPPAPAPLEEFVPIDQLPPEEQIPAASLLIPAYAFVWLAVLFYVVTVAKRLGNVQKEVERLESDIKQGKRI